MNRKNLKYLFFTFSLLFISCDKEEAWDCIKSTGEITTETRILENFNKIVLYDNINLWMIQDSTAYIEITAGKNLIPKISIEIENGILIIKNENKYNWLRSYKYSIDVYLHYLLNIWN